MIFVSPRLPAIGGQATAVENLSAALQSHGVQIRHVSIHPGDRDPTYPTWTMLPHEGLYRGPILRRRAHNPWSIASAAPKLVFKRIDRARRLAHFRRVVESLDTRSAIVFSDFRTKALLDESGYSRPRRGGPLMIGQHHEQFPSYPGEQWLRDGISTHFDDVDAFVALSPEDAAMFQSIMRPPCYSIPNTVARTNLTSSHSENLAVSLARFAGEKQLPLLVEMFAEATGPTNPLGWRLELYGEGVDEGLIQEAIDESGADDRVRIMGRTTQVEPIYARASVNLLASVLEGFGLTVVEAARAGVPTVAFDCSPGLHSLLADGAGFPVPNQDRAAYVSALADCLADREGRIAVGEVARARVVEFYPERVADRWLRLFAELGNTP